MLQVTQSGRGELGHEPRQSNSRQKREGLIEEGTFELEDGQEPACGGQREQCSRYMHS